MFKKLEDFFLNKFAGKLLARFAVTAAGFLSGQAASASVSIDPNELSAAFIAGGHAAFEWFKAWKLKKSAPKEEPKPEA